MTTHTPHTYVHKPFRILSHIGTCSHSFAITRPLPPTITPPSPSLYIEHLSLMKIASLLQLFSDSEANPSLTSPFPPRYLQNEPSPEERNKFVLISNQAALSARNISFLHSNRLSTLTVSWSISAERLSVTSLTNIHGDDKSSRIAVDVNRFSSFDLCTALSSHEVQAAQRCAYCVMSQSQYFCTLSQIRFTRYRTAAQTVTDSVRTNGQKVCSRSVRTPHNHWDLRLGKTWPLDLPVQFDTTNAVLVCMIAQADTQCLNTH